LNLGFRSTDVIRKNRKGLPEAKMEEKLEVGESRLLTKNDINLFVLQDKNKVIVLSIVYGGQIINKRRYDGTKWVISRNLLQLKNTICALMVLIELTKTFHTINRTAKQDDTRKYYYLKEVCLKNTHILHEECCRKNSIVPMQLEEFRLRFVEYMTKKYTNETGEMITRLVHPQERIEYY